MGTRAEPCEGCIHRHYVVAHPRGTSMTGWGCLQTGGHAVKRCSMYDNGVTNQPTADPTKYTVDDVRRIAAAARKDGWGKWPYMLDDLAERMIQDASSIKFEGSIIQYSDGSVQARIKGGESLKPGDRVVVIKQEAP